MPGPRRSSRILAIVWPLGTAGHMDDHGEKYDTLGYRKRSECSDTVTLLA